MSSLSAVVLTVFVAFASANVLPQPRIVGGENSRPGELLYVASVQTAQHGHICGATIIHSRWVVTAATCTISLWQGGFTIRTGTHVYNRGGVDHQTENLINHPKYDYNTRANDIALVKTATVIQTNAYTAILPVGTSVVEIANAVVAGWGHTVLNGRKSVQLQYLNTPTITNEVCKQQLAFNNFANLVQASNICAFSTFGQGICRADTGSPLVVNNELVGIASFGVSCATGVPDVYTRVSSYASWISTNAV